MNNPNVNFWSSIQDYGFADNQSQEGSGPSNQTWSDKLKGSLQIHPSQRVLLHTESRWIRNVSKLEQKQNANSIKATTLDRTASSRGEVQVGSAQPDRTPHNELAQSNLSQIRESSSRDTALHQAPSKLFKPMSLVHDQQTFTEGRFSSHQDLSSKLRWISKRKCSMIVFRQIPQYPDWLSVEFIHAGFVLTVNHERTYSNLEQQSQVAMFNIQNTMLCIMVYQSLPSGPGLGIWRHSSGFPIFESKFWNTQHLVDLRPVFDFAVASFTCIAERPPSLKSS